MPTEPQPQPPRSNAVRLTTMATQMGVTIFIGVYGGMKLDEKFPMRIPVFTLVLSLLSVGLALYMVIRDFVKKK